MPSQQGGGFENQQDVLPVVNAAGEKNQPEVIRLSELRLLNLAVEDDELLAEECVLGD